jgi:aldehyde:ferredoxin oxidoreductase
MKYLYVDLSERRIEEIEIPPDWKSRFIGGRGLGLRLLVEHTEDPSVDAFSSENLLVYSIGPLSKTNVPFSGRMNLTSFSPLTNTVFSSNVGGFLSEELYKTGYDAVVVTGKAENPCYLVIDRAPRIVDKKSLWGKDVFETSEYIKEKENVKDRNIACIGPAGENLVRFANIMVQKHRAFGRGGLGAVMGSKNLKAIVFKGKKREKRNPDFIDELRKKVRETPSNLKTMGTSNIITIANDNEALPTRYYAETKFERVDDISGERLKDFTIKADTCFSCLVACKRITKSETFNVTTDGPEYETLMAFGSNLLNSDLESIIYLNDLCDRYGIDTISAGSAVGCLIRGASQGMVQHAIRWGDIKKIEKVLNDIVHRKGIGEELAEGSAKFGKRYGIQSFHVKGLDLPGHDGRGLYGQALSYAVSNRGADHLYATVYIDEYNQPHRKDIKGKSRIVIKNENRNAVLDSLVLCKFSVRFYDEEDIERIADFSFNMEMEDLMRTGERIVNLERFVNSRRGFSRKDDILPPKMNIPIEEELQQYYRLRGWDEEGIPSERKLEELELSELIENNFQ